jgi:hydrogenase expression/formation protein HypE
MNARRRERVSVTPCLRDGRPFRIAAVVFDFDGTLTKPGGIDFAAVHEAVGCPQGTGLLEFLDGISDPEVRSRKEAILMDAEMEAAERCEVNEGAARLIAFLRERGVPMGIITRNRLEAIERALLAVVGIRADDFGCIVTRDVPLKPKPSPQGVRHMADELAVDVRELLLVGDHAFDIEAGARAGALTMFLGNTADAVSVDDTVDSDFVVDTLAEAERIIRYGLPLPLGKVPPQLLREYLSGIVSEDPDILVGPAVGEDAAALDVTGAEVLVMASDPVTLASDSMARYLVLANANDVAASGATPRWLLSTLLFPRGTSASEVFVLMRDIQAVCVGCGLTLCGGHTEISYGVSRPVAVGTVAGTALSSELIDKRRMREGDVILLTKGVAVEGTGLIGREYGRLLTKAGIPAAEISECVGYLEKIGILEEARIARGFGGVSALHDVTEGGLASAVSELGVAGGRRLRLHLDKIPVYPQTERVCEALGLRPLGLLGSGSLLITCSAADAVPLGDALEAAGIDVSAVGEVLGKGEGIEALRFGVPEEWPSFDRDEVTRLVD